LSVAEYAHADVDDRGPAPNLNNFYDVATSSLNGQGEYFDYGDLYKGATSNPVGGYMAHLVQYDPTNPKDYLATYRGGNGGTMVEALENLYAELNMHMSMVLGRLLSASLPQWPLTIPLQARSGRVSLSVESFKAEDEQSLRNRVDQPNSSHLARRCDGWRSNPELSTKS
jgi:hypothetical protein